MTTTPITPERMEELRQYAEHRHNALTNAGFSPHDDVAQGVRLSELLTLLTLADRAEAYEKALREIASEKVSQQYVHSVLAVSPDCNRACLWCEAVDSVESFARTALASQGA
jgi:hypothetical protein